MGNRSSALAVELNPPSPEECSSKEFDLLCACAGVELFPGRIARIARAAESTPDWDALFRQAEFHGVLPLLAYNLTEHARTLSPEVEAFLRSTYEENVRRNLWFANELVRTIGGLDKERVRAVPYKGPVLAASVYGDLALRSFSDLDLLISPDAFDQSKQALQALGYRPSEQLTPPVERFWLKKGYERSFDSSNGKNLLELQWALLPYFYAVDLRLEDLLARSVHTLVGGKKVPCLSPEDSLLVLCLHAAKHLWTRLIWVCDIAETMRTQTVDYELLLLRARETGILRIVGVSVWLTKHLLEATVPPAFQEVITADPEVRILGQEFAARLARQATYDLDSSDYFRLIRRLRERRQDRWRYLWLLIWTPGAGDLAVAQLPDALFPLYRLVRLARLLRRLRRL